MEKSSKTIVVALIAALVVVSGSFAAFAYSVVNAPKAAIENESDIIAPVAATNFVPSSYLYVQNAASGTLAKQDGTYKLTLNGVSSTTISFTDRPERVADKISTQDFVDEWSTGTDSFAADPPNAALVIYEGDAEKTLVLELQKPVYENGVLQYDVLFLNSYGHVATPASGALEPEGDIPSSFAQVALFIDDRSNVTLHDATSCEGIGGTWTDNGAICELESDVTIDAYDLVIPQGVGLEIYSHTLTIASGQTITNSGTITIDLTGAIATASPTMRDFSIAGHVIYSYHVAGGAITNNGTILNDAGTINNDGTIANGGSIYNLGSITISGSGTLINDDHISNEYLITNNGGSITNSGTISNELGRYSGGNIYNYGSITNGDDGTISNFDIFTNGNGGTITNDGTITNSGPGITITNDGGTICGRGTIDDDYISSCT